MDVIMSAPRDREGRLIFKCSDYCALCRETLHLPRRRFNPVPELNDAWKYKVVGLYNIGDTDRPSRIVAALLDFEDYLCFEEITVNFASGQSLVLHVKGNFQISDEDRVAHFVHFSCWKLMRALDSSCTPQSVYEFAESTYSLFDTTHVPEGQDITATGFVGVTNENANRTDLGDLLNRISRLPLELQLEILEDCPPNLLSSLLTVAHTTSTLVSAFRHSQGQRHIELICHSDVKSLCARSVSIFGSNYISSLGFNELSESSEEVPVNAAEITGFKFALGRYGIKALRICYASNESSEWLGDPRDGWFGVIHGSDIRSLRILCDDLKYIRIDFMHNSPTREQSQLLLDKDIAFRTGDHHRILDTWISPDVRNYPRNYPMWRMCNYLPFFDGKGYISSLTMFCDGHTITGMETYGLSLRSIGGCGNRPIPMHLFLRPGERITSIWLRMCNSLSNSWLKPNIMVLTNLNRTHVFGSSLLHGSGFDLDYQWTLLNDDPGSMPIGIFFDVLTREGTSQKINNIGVTQRIGSPNVQGISPMIPALQTLPYKDPSINMDCYLTIASFAHIKELRILRRGRQRQLCGIAVHHHDGSIDVLGQWTSSPPFFPTEAEKLYLPPHSYFYLETEKIYDHKDGTLTAIAFGFSNGDDPLLVDSITLAIDHKPHIEDTVPKLKLLKIFPVNAVDPPTIMWWLGPYYDYVALWEGEYVPPSMSGKQYDITEFEADSIGRE